MSKFKVGDTVRFKQGVHGFPAGTLVRVVELEAVINGMCWDYMLKAGDMTFGCDGDGGNLELATPTLDNLSVDDVVVTRYGNEQTVAAVLGRVVFLEDSLGYIDGDQPMTVRELKDKGFTVKDWHWTVKSEPSVTEVTLDQVAEKFGVPVEQLKVRK